MRPAVRVGLLGEDEHRRASRSARSGIVTCQPASATKRRDDDVRRVEQRVAEVGAAAPLAAQPVDAVEQEAGLVDRVDGAAVAPVRVLLLGVAGAARHLDRAVDGAAAGGPDLERARLGDDREVGRRRRGARRPAPPTPLDSSSVFVHTITSPRSPPVSASASAASTIAAIPPFMSHAPRPTMRPSATCGSNGSAPAVLAAAGTTSMWPLSSSDARRREPRRRAASCGRPSKPMPPATLSGWSGDVLAAPAPTRRPRRPRAREPVGERRLQRGLLARRLGRAPSGSWCRRRSGRRRARRARRARGDAVGQRAARRRRA